MKVCVVGSGGREHALALALARTAEVVVAPGNPGMAPHSPDAADSAHFTLVAGCRSPSPRTPRGRRRRPVRDRARAAARRRAGRPAAGRPATRLRARRRRGPPRGLEGLHEGGPGRGGRAHGPLRRLRRGQGRPGVPARAARAVGGEDRRAGRGQGRARHRLAGPRPRPTSPPSCRGTSFGDAGRRVVVEEGLVGPECSLLVLCDGTRIAALAPAQDFKRIGDGDDGAQHRRHGGLLAGARRSIDRLVDTRARRGRRAAGGRLAPAGHRLPGRALRRAHPHRRRAPVLEYNVRFGDPETQVVLPRLTEDLTGLLAEAAAGRLRTEPRFSTDAAVCVVLASEGYPGARRAPATVIDGLEAAADRRGRHRVPRRDRHSTTRAGSSPPGAASSG